MYEDTNGTMIPGSAVKRELYRDFHHLVLQSESVSTLFEDQSPIEETRNAGGPIDGDESLDKLLASYGC